MSSAVWQTDVPELRLTNRGYVNCLTFEMEPLLAD